MQRGRKDNICTNVTIIIHEAQTVQLVYLHLNVLRKCIDLHFWILCNTLRISAVNVLLHMQEDAGY